MPTVSSLQFSPPAPISRRDAFVKVLELALAGSIITLLPRCDEDIREWVVNALVAFDPDVFTAFALDASAEAGLEFIDARCHACKIAFRIAMAGAVALDAVCPYCGIAVKVTVLVSALVLQQLKDNQIQKVIGFASPDGRYTVSKVGPSIINYQLTAVARSTVSYDYCGAQPIGSQVHFKPENDGLYYTTVVTGATDQPLVHVWRWNGRPMDRIKKPDRPNGILGSAQPNGVHTSHKKSSGLPRGIWNVTAVAPNGAILDSQTFSVKSAVPRRRALS
jgi:hypothetical protein